MGYGIDFTRISIAEYKNMLKTGRLLPGRLPLLNSLDGYFDIIEKSGIKNLNDLKAALSTPKKFEAFVNSSGIPSDYLTLLKREFMSMEPKSVPVKDFAAPQLIELLLAAGIKTSEDVYTAGEAGLKAKGVPEKEIRLLIASSDLMRINGIRAVAAKLFADAGYPSLKSVAEADASKMLAKVSGINSNGEYYAGKLQLKDITFCIDNAKVLIKYS